MSILNLTNEMLYLLLALSLAGMLFFVSRIPQPKDYPDRPTGGLNPGLTLQVPVSPDDLWGILGRGDASSPANEGNRLTAERAQWRDFPFIPCYCCFFVSAGLLQYKRLGVPARYLGLAAAAFIVAAALFDAFGENIGILHAIEAVRKGQTPDTGYAHWGWLKWTATFIAQAFLTPLLFDLQYGLGHNWAFWRWTGRILAAAVIAAALLGFSAYFGDRMWLQVATYSTLILPLFLMAFGLFSGIVKTVAT